MTKKDAIYDGFFIVLLATICHFLFSKYGFNPTDEGFVLSTSNRLLHGQIPHLDFSSVRPLGYAYLHIPELLISKNYVFLISRFVFFLEQTLIAYLWIRFVIEFSKTEILRCNKYTLIIICFVFNVHYFPCSVMHTVDGLLMCLLGLNIIISENKKAFIGFLFIGFAALCKQNYIIILPISILLFSRKNIALNVFIAVLPIVTYVGIISLYGGFGNLSLQLSTHAELIKVGIFPYIFSKLFFVGILISFCILRLNSKFLKNIFFYLLIIICCYAMITNRYHEKFSFLIFGVSLGYFIFSFYKKQYNYTKLFLICLALAWSVSISVGYNSPALFLGACLSLIFISQFHLLNTAKPNWFLIFILAQVICMFFYVRKNNIYRDAASKLLTYKLDGIVEGAFGIYTNLNTFKVLVELDLLNKKYPNLIVIPDFAACNILHSHLSKIRTEWPNKTEVPNEQILNFVITDLENDSSIIAIPKYNISKINYGFEKVPKNKVADFLILNYVFNHYKKIEDYSYFELYKK